MQMNTLFFKTNWFLHITYVFRKFCNWRIFTNFYISILLGLLLFICELVRYHFKTNILCIFLLSTVKPTFSTLIPRKISILEGNWKLINFSTRANPPKVTYSLWRDGQGLNLHNVYSHFHLDEGGVLNITKAQQKDSGDYQIKAVNAEGTAFFNFTLDIQCKYQFLLFLTILFLFFAHSSFVSCFFRMWQIMTLHNLLSFEALRNIFLLSLPLTIWYYSGLCSIFNKASK